MAPQHNQNPSWCGACGTWITGIWQHERTKMHQAAIEPIRQQLVAQRAERRAANNSAAETYVPPV